jgi:rare lipoprotein A
MNVQTGRHAVVRGVIQPAGSTVALQIRRGNRWVTLDRDRTDARGAYVLRDRQRSPLSARARVKVSQGPAGSRRVGRLNVYRSSYASWYGPGLYGGTSAAAARSTPATSASRTSRCPAGTR